MNTRRTHAAPAPEAAPMVAYLRVSTQRQGRSGLGLNAQREAVERYAAASGGRIVAEYVETESGTLAERPELHKAIGHARRAKAKLVIARIDRLSRNVAFLAALMDSGLDFVAVDNPHANPLTVHILAAVAQYEAKAIAERTRLALQAAKARGQKLGSHRPGHWDDPKRQQARRAGAAKGNQRSAKVRAQRAREAVADLLPTMQAMRAEGQSYAAIAEALNAQGQQTPRGCAWKPASVQRALSRAEAPAAA